MMTMGGLDAGRNLHVHPSVSQQTLRPALCGAVIVRHEGAVDTDDPDVCRACVAEIPDA